MFFFFKNMKLCKEIVTVYFWVSSIYRYMCRNSWTKGIELYRQNVSMSPWNYVDKVIKGYTRKYYHLMQRRAVNEEERNKKDRAVYVLTHLQMVFIIQFIKLNIRVWLSLILCEKQCYWSSLHRALIWLWFILGLLSKVYFKCHAQSMYSPDLEIVKMEWGRSLGPGVYSQGLVYPGSGTVRVVTLTGHFSISDSGHQMLKGHPKHSVR